MNNSWEIIVSTIWFVWIFSLLSSRLCSPIIYIFARWARWFSIAITGAYILTKLNPSSHPTWILFTVSFMGWFLIESIYNWVFISALSQSDFNLFPKYEENTKGDEWPTQKRFIHLREEIRKKNFTKNSALKTDIMKGEEPIRSSLFISEDKKSSLQIVFLPSMRNKIYSAYSITSQLEDGTRIITDNFFLPYAGFFPENWSIQRKPWTRNFNKLLTIHNKRLEQANSTAVNCNEDPIPELNKQNEQLRQLNTELGFLVPYEEQELYGQITREGRYLIWKENWCLNYLGIPAKYN